MQSPTPTPDLRMQERVGTAALTATVSSSIFHLEFDDKKNNFPPNFKFHCCALFVRKNFLCNPVQLTFKTRVLPVRVQTYIHEHQSLPKVCVSHGNCRLTRWCNCADNIIINEDFNSGIRPSNCHRV